MLDPRALDAAVSRLTQFARDLDIDFVVAAEARGFILGGALARELQAGFIPARKRGKLPHPTVSSEFALEYGIDALEVHSDALAGGVRVLIHDDLLATGGTAGALADLVKQVGGEIVACAFLVELRSSTAASGSSLYPGALADRLRRLATRRPRLDGPRESRARRHRCIRGTMRG